jgi:monothiol glutaredoxin
VSFCARLLRRSLRALWRHPTRQTPQGGFSRRATQLPTACGATFASVDVLADPALREGIKQFSSWPTVPQLYIKGQFIGGSDIMAELHQKGELQKLVAEAQAGAKTA